MSSSTEGPALSRIEEQIKWYSQRSKYNQRLYKLLKVWTITVAALVPLLAALGSMDVRVLAALTATIAVVEGVQQVNQYQANWISYRSTCEALKHEKYLYLSWAGPYRSKADADVLLAERTEGIVSQEHAKWVLTQEEPAKKEAPKP